MERLKNAFIEFTDAYFDIFVERLKVPLPWRVPFFRSDNKEGLFTLRWKPLGYWIGHLVGYIILFLLWTVLVYLYIKGFALFGISL